MALTVISFATYLSRPGWTDGDRNALKFVKAIKGKPFKYSADVPVVGKLKRLTSANADDAVEWFGDLATSEILKLNLRGPLILVPVPNSSSTVKNNKKPRTALLAEAIAKKLRNATVWDGLRWIEENVPTHQEGTRDPEELYPNLTMTSSPPTTGTLILVDDVYTQGGHVQAAVARLREKKAVCRLAVCAGRTVLVSQNQPFAVVHQQIADFNP